MNQALIESIQQLHGESELVEERLSFIDKQVAELTDFLGHLSFLAQTKEENFFSSMGKGIFLEATLKSKQLFVDAGAGVIVKKSISDVQIIIQGQLQNLSRMRSESQAQLQMLQNEFETIISRIENERAQTRKTI